MNSFDMESPSPNQLVIEFRDVLYTLPNAKPLLQDLNLKVFSSETLVLLGRSGSGKRSEERRVGKECLE